jgi:hypothetical protein
MKASTRPSGDTAGKLSPAETSGEVSLRGCIQTAMDAHAGGYDVSMRDMNAHKQQYDAMLAAGLFAIWPPV